MLNANKAAGAVPARPGEASGSRQNGKRPVDVLVLDDNDDSSDLEQVSFRAAGSSPQRAKRVRWTEDDDEPAASDDVIVAGPSNAKRNAPAIVVDDNDNDLEDPRTEADRVTDSVCSIVVDVQREHVLELAASPALGMNVDAIINHLLDSGDYPRIERADPKGKGKQRAVEEEPAIDYLAPDRKWWGLSPYYTHAAINQLGLKFPSIPIPFIRAEWNACKLYAPAYYRLKAEQDKAVDQRAYRQLRQPRKPVDAIHDPALDKEAAWVEKREVQERLKKHEEFRKRRLEEQERLQIQQELATGAFTECTCCCEEAVAISQSFFCTEGHAVCKECSVRNAETQIGSLKYELPCPSMDGCHGHFTMSEARRFLPQTSIDALHKIKQEREIELAQLEGLSKCPFCPFACIIEDPNERLMRCQHEDCMAVTCRQCHRPDHLPKTCKEAQADDKVSALHTVEEAMSAALIRQCPQCSKPYVKLDGCNKMRCPCGVLSCFICSKVIKGYEHFTGAGSNAAYTEKGASCPLWDDTNKRTYEEVEQARVKALADVPEEKLDKDHADKLKGEAPPPRPDRMAALYGYAADLPPAPLPPLAAPLPRPAAAAPAPAPIAARPAAAAAAALPVNRAHPPAAPAAAGRAPAAVGRAGAGAHLRQAADALEQARANLGGIVQAGAGINLRQAADVIAQVQANLDGLAQRFAHVDPAAAGEMRAIAAAEAAMLARLEPYLNRAPAAPPVNARAGAAAQAAPRRHERRLPTPPVYVPQPPNPAPPIAAAPHAKLADVRRGFRANRK